jgi:hypothetical protein
MIFRLNLAWGLLCFFSLTTHAQQAGPGEHGDRIAATGETGLTAVIDQPSPAIGCGQPVTLTATITGATEISWKRNGEFINGATTSTFVANQPGVYQVVAISLLCQLESVPVEVILESPLNASISAPSGTSACEGNTVLLQASGGIAQWQWYRNGIALSDGISESYEASVPGNYVVAGNEGSFCASTSPSVQVTIYPLPIAQLTWAESPQLCPGDSATIVTSISAQEEVQWYFDESIVAVGNTELTATLAGEYHAIITNTITGCSNQSNSLSLAVFPAQSIVVTALTPLAFCEGQSATLVANTVSASLNWYQNNLPVQGVTEPALIVYSAGSYSARITDENGCTAVSNALITETLPLPDASILFDVAFPVLCGDDDTLLIYTAPANEYTWYSQTDVIVDAQTFELAITNPGSYSVEVTGDNGCTASSPAIEVASFDAPQITLEPTGLINLCEGQSQLFEAITSGQGQLYWHLNGVWQEVVFDSFWETAEGGVYQVSVVDDNGCEAYSETAELAVIIVETPVILNGGITAEGQLLLTDAAAGHQWYLNGEMIPGATEAEYNATENGVYSVISIEDVCESELSAGFEVILGDVSIHDSSRISVYPNPCSDFIRLEIKPGAGSHYVLYDSSGRVVSSEVIAGAITIFDTQSWSEGLYHIVTDLGLRRTFTVAR